MTDSFQQGAALGQAVIAALAGRSVFDFGHPPDLAKRRRAADVRCAEKLSVGVYD